MFFVLKQFENPHNIRMRHLLKNFKLISHEVLEDLTIFKLVFTNDFYGAFIISLSMHCYANLPKATFTQYSTNLVPIFNVFSFFESSIVFEIEDMVIQLLRWHPTIPGFELHPGRPHTRVA